jgi:hypothetical protein
MEFQRAHTLDTVHYRIQDCIKFSILFYHMELPRILLTVTVQPSYVDISE